MKRRFGLALLLAAGLSLGTPSSRAFAQSAPASPQSQALLQQFAQAYQNAPTAAARQQILQQYAQQSGSAPATPGLTGALGQATNPTSQTGANQPSVGDQLLAMAAQILGNFLAQLLEQALNPSSSSSAPTPAQIAALQNELDGLQSGAAAGTGALPGATGTTGTPGSTGSTANDPAGSPLNGANGTSASADGATAGDPGADASALGPTASSGSPYADPSAGLGGVGPSMPLGGGYSGPATGGGAPSSVPPAGGGAGGSGGAGSGGSSDDPGYSDTIKGRLLIFPKVQSGVMPAVDVASLTPTEAARFDRLRSKLKPDDVASIGLVKVESVISNWKVEAATKKTTGPAGQGNVGQGNVGQGNVGQGNVGPGGKDELASVRMPDGTIDLKKCDIWLVKDWKGEIPKRFRVKPGDLGKALATLTPGSTVTIQGTVTKGPDIAKEIKDDVKGSLSELAAKTIVPENKDAGQSSDSISSSGSSGPKKPTPAPSPVPGLPAQPKPADTGDLENE
jgi:hypothetical protein